MNLPDRPEAREFPGRVGLRRGSNVITVRRFVVSVACLAATAFVWSRTGDWLLTIIAAPLVHGFLNYWLVD